MKASQIKAVADQESIERRTVRAVVQCMVVDEHATPEGSGRFEVHSESGNTYEVDLTDGSCTCPDFEKREDQLRNGTLGDGCKHARRVRFALGLDPVPVALRDDVDPALEASRRKFGALDEDEPAEELIADGGEVEEHAPGCDDPRCEGLQADGRPELSFACWEVWAAESHDWSEERAAVDMTPTEQDVTDVALERALVEKQAVERGGR